MAQNVSEFDISKTYRNVVLTNVTGEPDTDGLPTAVVPARRTGNMALRDQGRVQDGFGTSAPLVLTSNLIEVESEPASAFSAIRRVDLVNLYASSFINNLLWS
jgi:hypothetical protein